METCWTSATPNIPKPSLCFPSGAKASNTGTKLWDTSGADMSWFGLITSCHFERVGNSNFHGDRSKGIARSQMSSKRSPDCIATSAAPIKGMKMKTQQNHNKNWRRKTRWSMAWYFAMFRRHSHVSNKLTQIMSNQLISSNSQAKAEEFFQRHLQLNQIQSSLRLAVVKVQVIEPTRTSAKPWSAAARSAVPGAVDTEAAAVAAAEDVHSIRHGAPYRCMATAGWGRRAARGQLTPAIGLAKVAEMFVSYKETIDSKSFLQNPITILILQKLSTIGLATWPWFTQILVFSTSSPPLRR